MNKYDEYLTYDEPIPYKDLLIYPVKMKDYIKFHAYVSCLLLDKNGSGNMEYIKMTYLQYIYCLSVKNEMPCLYLFNELLKMVLHLSEKDEIKYIGEPEGKIPAEFIINNKKYDNNDLKEIKKIIFMQNEIDDIDETISKEVRDAMQEAEEYRLRQSSNKMCSLEDQMLCVSMFSPYKINDIYELTIRKFSKILKRIDHTLHYKIYLSAKMSGMVEFKDKDSIRHWMCDLTKDDIYQSDKIDMEKMKEKIDGINQ